ncbi:hypothetical protein ACFQX7_40160 [Luedemannella flava]
MTRDQVDAALAALEAGHARIATVLYSVDTHPGHVYLRDTAVQGRTQELWRDTAPRVDALWPSFAALRDAIDQVAALRAAHPAPTGRSWAS